MTDYENYEEDGRIDLLLEKFEAMIESGEEYFFDVEDLEHIIDHYLITHQYPKAKKAIRFGNKLYPKNGDIQLREAQMMASTGKVMAAVPRLEALSKLEPTNPEVWIALGSIYSHLQKHKSAIVAFKNAMLHADPELIDELYIDLALEHENINHWDEAIMILKDALRANPKNDTATYELAYCYELAGKLSHGVKFYKRFIDRFPYSFTAWHNLGNTYQQMELIPEAIDAYEFSLAIEPQFSPAYFSLGSAHVKQAKFDLALEAFAEAQKIEGDQPYLMCCMGECYEKMGKIEEARQLYLRCLEKDAEYSEAYIGLGVLDTMEDKYAEAVAQFEKAVSVEAGNLDFNLMLADALRKAGHANRAIDLYKSLLHNNPKEEDIWLDYTAMLSEKDDHTAANKAISSALIIIPDAISLKFRQVAYLYRQGAKDKAYTIMEELLAKHPGHYDELLEYFPTLERDNTFAALIDLYQ